LDNKKYRIAVYIITIILLGQSLFNIILLYRSIFLSYGLNYSEPLILATAFNLYKSFGTYPYLITYYTPLFYILVRMMSSIMPQFVSTDPYFYIRSMGFAATIISALLIYVIARYVTEKKLLGVFALSIFLSSELVLKYGASFSPMPMELAFELFAVYLMLKPGSRRIIFSAVSIFIAFMFRQSAIFIFVALLIYLLYTKRFRDALLFSVLLIGAVITATVCIDAVTANRFFFSIFVIPLITPSALIFLLFNIFSFVKLTYFSAFVFLALAWFFMFERRNAIISILLLVSGIEALSSAKYGATSLYFMPFLAFFSIAVALGAKKIISSRGAKGMNFLNFKFAMVYTLLIFSFMVVYELVHYNSLYIYNATQPPADRIGIMLRNVSGPILVEDPRAAVAAGKPILFEPSIFWVLQADGIWNDSNVVGSIDNCSFGAIGFPLGYGRFVGYPEIINAIKEHYIESYSDYGWVVMVPRKSC